MKRLLDSKWKWLLALVFVTGSLYLMGSSAVQSAYDLIENAGSPITKRQTLNFVNGGCVDNSGTHATDCTLGASNTGVGLTSFTQTFASATSVTITDNAGTTSKQVQCFDGSGNVIVPQNVAITSTTVTTVTFGASQSGSCVVMWSAAAGALFRQTASVTVANSVTETTLTGTGVGSLTLPANFFNGGTTLKVRALGIHSATGTPTVRVKIKIGSVIVLDTGAVATGASTNAMVDIEGWITCRTTGATGTVFSQGWYREIQQAAVTTTAANYAMSNTTTSTIDTTASNAVDVTWQWGTASVSNTVTATNLIVESTGP